jgi:tetratricopeptide (TPR) repeat protein
MDLPEGSGFDARREQALRSLRGQYLGALAMAGRWSRRRELLRAELESMRAKAESDSADVQDLNSYSYNLATVPDDALRDDAEALRVAKEAVARLEDDDPVQAGLTYDTLAKAYERNGDLPAALEAERESVRSFFLRPGAETALDAGRSTAMVVRYALELGDRAAAADAVDFAMSSLGETHADDPSGRSRGLRFVGERLRERGFPALAEQPLRSAVEAARGEGAEEQLVEALCVLAIQRANAGDPHEASRLVDEARSVYREHWVTGPIDWVPGLGMDGTDEGERSRIGNRLKEGIVSALLATGRVKEARELHEQVLCVGGWSDCVETPRLLVLEGKHEEAEDHWHKRVARAWTNRSETSDPCGMAAYEAGWARCLMELGRWKEAEVQLRRARDRYREWAGSGSERLQRVEERLAACRNRRLDEWRPGAW